MLKRIAVLLLAALLLVTPVLVGCSKSDDGEGAEAAPEQQEMGKKLFDQMQDAQKGGPAKGGA